jgi:Uma2 family endonuclease
MIEVTLPMPLAEKKSRRFSYRDYLSWKDNVRRELFDGVIVDMTPGPSRLHQELCGGLFYQIYGQLNGKKCSVYPAPFDVRFPGKSSRDEDIYTVVQPDITVVCDKNKLDSRGCIGAPDLIIEILSPETASRDMKEKLSLYEAAGVKEYWIVHPEDRTVMILTLDKTGKYGRPSVYSGNDVCKSRAVRGLTVEIAPLFRDIK